MENLLKDKTSVPTLNQPDVLDDLHEVDTGLDLNDLYDIGTGVHIISIAYNDNDEMPHVDLGDCSPIVAMTLLRAVIETLAIMLPPIEISYKGNTIISNNFDFYDDDDNDDNGDMNE